MESHKKIICMPFLGAQCMNHTMSFIITSGNGFPGGSAPTVQEMQARKIPGERNGNTLPGLGRSPRERNGNTPQYSCLENPMDRGAQ